MAVVLLALLFTLLLPELGVQASSSYLEKMHGNSYLLALDVDTAFNPIKRKAHLRKHHILFDLDTQPSEYPNSDSYDPPTDSKTRELYDRYRHICFTNQSSFMNSTDKLRQFRDGVCSPVLLVPGFMGSKLVVKIDCNTLRTKHPDFFSDCGWDTCSESWWQPWIAQPKPQYILWVGLQLALKPMLTGGEDRKCFGNLISFLFDDRTKDFKSVQGAQVTWFGNTPATSSHSNCGSNAITDIAGYWKILSSTCEPKGFRVLIDVLVGSGYQSGLTLQALPYDWRLSLEDSSTKEILPRAIRHLYNMTGKKVVIIGHSYGGLHTLHALTFFLTQEQKNLMVRDFISMGTPYGGTAGSLKGMMLGDPTLFFDGVLGFGKGGINYQNQKRLASTAGSFMDLIVRPLQPNSSNSTMNYELILKRKAHQSMNSKSKNPFPFLPNAKMCSDCSVDFIDYTYSTPILYLGPQRYYASIQNYTALFQKLSSLQSQPSLIALFNKRMAYKYNLDQGLHPGVNMTIFYTSNKPTLMNFQITNQLMFSVDYSRGKTFPTYLNENKTKGDGTVTTHSALYFAPIWQKTKQPQFSIRYIHYDSTRQQEQVYPAYQYFKRIPSECILQGESLKSCSHVCMISDKYNIMELVKVLTNDGKGYEEDRGNGTWEFWEPETRDVLGIMSECEVLRGKTA